MAKIDFAHKAQRKMFEVVLDAAIKHSDSDRRKALMQLVDLIEKTLGDVWGPAAYKMFRDIFSDPDSKWTVSYTHLDVYKRQMRLLVRM